MKVCGFSFIRNAIQFDYPIVEAITSILPVCDAFVIAVGHSDDETLTLIKGIGSPKIRIIETFWDDSMREGGRVLAHETDKAFQAISAEYDWAFYIQGDEVIHEKYLPVIQRGMERYLNDKKVEGLLFNYLHFYGSYDYLGEALSWYRREVRIVRNQKAIFSFQDAQGFRREPNQKLRVKLIDAYIYHYGWVRDPGSLQNKHVSMQRHWHNDEWIDRNIVKGEQFDYGDAESLSRFDGVHPKVMMERINKMNWHFDRDLSKDRFSFKDKIKLAIERLFGWRMGEYKNFILLK